MIVVSSTTTGEQRGSYEWFADAINLKQGCTTETSCNPQEQ